MYNIFDKKGLYMIIAVSVLIISIITFLIFKFAPKINLSKIGSIIFGFIVILTAIICIIKPALHKQFSINTIEYLIKINDDGTMTTTKQTTTTVLEKKK